MDASDDLKGIKRNYNGEPIEFKSSSHKQPQDDAESMENIENLDFLADSLESLMRLEKLDEISHFIVPNLKILHKMAILALRIMNLIFSSSQATSEKESLLTLLYGKKAEFDDSKDSDGTDSHESFEQLLSLFMKLWFGHFNKKAYNFMDESTAYSISQIKKKDVFLSYGDVFEIFKKYPIYDDLLLLPTPLLYNQFLFFFHNNKSIVEANLEMELRANHINNDVNGNISRANSHNADPFLLMNNNSINNTAAFELFIKNMDFQKDSDFGDSHAGLPKNDENLLDDDLFDNGLHNTHSYSNNVLSIPFKVQYHMFQLLQKINFCMFMLMSLRLTPHDLTVVDKFSMEAMNGNIQPIRNSKKFKPNSNLTVSQIQLQNLNKCNADGDFASANGAYRFFELDTKKLIESSGMLDPTTAGHINDKALISDGDTYQIFMDEYQTRLYNSMYDGNSVRSIKKIMKGHINIFVEFKTQVFVYELEKYNIFKKHNSQQGLLNIGNDETGILNNVFDMDKVIADIQYLKKPQDRNIINGTEQTLIDKLKIRRSNISKKISLNDDFSRLINIQDLIKHYEWFDFVVLFVQFLQKKFFQISSSKVIISAAEKTRKFIDGSHLANMFASTSSSASTIFSNNSNSNSVASTPMEYFSAPSTPQCNTHYSFSANSSVGPPSVKINGGSTCTATPLCKNSNSRMSLQSGNGPSPKNSTSPILMPPAIFLTANNTPTQYKPDGITSEKGSPLISMNSVISKNTKRSVSRNLWTKEEETALIQGLKICGPSWSQILELYGTGGFVSEALKNRKDLQLKDKARNWKVWLYSSDIKTIPPYFYKVTGGVERSVTGGYKIKRLLFLNNCGGNSEHLSNTPKAVSRTPKSATPGKKKDMNKKKNYKGIALKLDKFLYKDEDVALAKRVEIKYGTNFILSQSMDIKDFNFELMQEINELKKK